MFSLILDISGDSVYRRRTYRKRSVPLLPIKKSGDLFMNPFRRIGFQITQKIIEAVL